MRRSLFVACVLSLALAMGCGKSKSKDDNGNNPVVSNDPEFITLNNHFVFDNNFDATQKSLLQGDFAVLAAWDSFNATGVAELKRISGLSTVTAASTSAWLRDRIKYMLPGNVPVFQVGAVVISDRVIVTINIPGAEESDSVGASNIGTAFYDIFLQVKADGADGLVFSFNGGFLPVLSPRVGIMNIGPALFDQDFQVNPANPAAVSNSLARIETLFHEGRHSDGSNAKGSFGFAHPNCPNSEEIPPELIGLPACDNFWNGAYNIGGQMLASMSPICAACSTQEKAGIQSLYLDSLSRILVSNDDANLGDATPEVAAAAIDTTGFRVQENE